MKKQSTIMAIALVTSVTFMGFAYAQDAVPPAVAAPAPADAGKAKETQKEQVQQESAQLSPDKAKLYNDAMQQAIESNKDLRARLSAISVAKVGKAAMPPLKVT